MFNVVSMAIDDESGNDDEFAVDDESGIDSELREASGVVRARRIFRGILAAAGIFAVARKRHEGQQWDRKTRLRLEK